MHITTSPTLSKVCWPLIKLCELIGEHWPGIMVRIRYFARFHRFPNLKDPQDLNEKYYGKSSMPIQPDGRNLLTSTKFASMSKTLAVGIYWLNYMVHGTTRTISTSILFRIL